MEPEKSFLKALGEVLATPPWELWPAVQPFVEFLILGPLVCLAVALAWQVLSTLGHLLAWLLAMLWWALAVGPLPRGGANRSYSQDDASDPGLGDQRPVEIS